MNLHNIILFASLGCVNAQGIIPRLFNFFFAENVEFNMNVNIAAGLSSTADPLALDMLETINVDADEFNSCENTTTVVSFTVEHLDGLASLLIDEVSMTSFSFGCIGFAAAARFSMLEVFFSGEVEADGCDTTSKNSFTGEAELLNSSLEWEIITDTTTGFFSIQIDSVNVTAWDITWDSLDMSLSNVGEFSSIESELEAAISEGVTDAIMTLVDGSVLENAMNANMPITMG